MKIKQIGTYEKIFNKHREKKRATKLRSYVLLFTFLCMCLGLTLLVSKGVTEGEVALVPALGIVDYKTEEKGLSKAKINASFKAHSLILRDIKMHNATRFFRNQSATGQAANARNRNILSDELQHLQMRDDEIKDTVLKWESEFLSAVN